MEEVQSAGAKLRFARTLEEFIKAHAPSHVQVTEQVAYDLCPKQLVLDRFEIAARQYFPKYWPSAELQILQRSINFVGGKLYDVAPSSKYGELEFEGVLELKVVTSEYPIYISYPTQQLFSPFSGVMSATGEWSHVSAPLHVSGPLNVRSTEIARTSVLPEFAPMTDEEILKGSLTEATRSRLSARFVPSMRVVRRKATKIETENFRVTEVANKLPPETAA